MQSYSLVFTIIIILMCGGCSSVENDWEDAKKLNTIEAYQDFVKNYPDSKFDSTAKAAIEALAWENAKSKSTYESYLDFSHNYPNSGHIAEIKVKIDFRSFVMSNVTNITDSSLDGYTKDDLGVRLKDMSVHAAQGKLAASGRFVPDLSSETEISGTFGTLLGDIEKSANIDSMNYIYSDSSR